MINWLLSLFDKRIWHCHICEIKFKSKDMRVQETPESPHNCCNNCWSMTDETPFMMCNVCYEGLPYFELNKVSRRIWICLTCDVDNDPR